MRSGPGDGECLDGNGELSRNLDVPSVRVTIWSNTVSCELVVSSMAPGATSAIRALHVESGDLAMDLIRSRGVLPPGSYVSLAGIPSMPDVGRGTSSVGST